MNSTKVVIVAHNDCEVVKVQIEFMIKISGFSSTDFIIVDNYSDDGLSQWLSIQKDMDYIICDELHSLIKFQYFSRQPNMLKSSIRLLGNSFEMKMF